MAGEKVLVSQVPSFSISGRVSHKQAAGRVSFFRRLRQNTSTVRVEMNYLL